MAAAVMVVGVVQVRGVAMAVARGVAMGAGVPAMAAERPPSRCNGLHCCSPRLPPRCIA